MSVSDARAVLRETAAAYIVAPDPPGLLSAWIDLCERYTVVGRRAHDARLVAYMSLHEITHILTLNPDDFLRYAEIRVLTPGDL
jgi:hypothetical protein